MFHVFVLAYPPPSELVFCDPPPSRRPIREMVFPKNVRGTWKNPSLSLGPGTPPVKRDDLEIFLSPTAHIWEHISSYFLHVSSYFLHISSYFLWFWDIEKFLALLRYMGSRTWKKIQAISSKDLKYVSIAENWTGVIFTSISHNLSNEGDGAF